jgi:phosphatidyl-myo-inositol dimannoside synthase
VNTLLFTLEYPPFKGGVANYYLNIVNYWPSVNNNLATKLAPDNIFVLNNNENTLIKDWLFPKWLPAFFVLYKIIKKKQIDHIIIGHLLPLGTVAYLITKITKTPYSVMIHGMDFSYSQKNKRKAKITERILNKAVQIICTNSYVVDLINQTYLNKFNSKIHVINPGINVYESHNPLQKDSDATKLSRNNFQFTTEGILNKYELRDKIILLSIGRLVKRKGFDMVIKTMPEILKSIPNLTYIIAGTGPDENYLKNLAFNQNNIIFTGEISDQEKWTLLKNCDIFITVSRDIAGDFEGFGIVYLEAALAGKPVIAGNSGGVKDAVVNNETGILINNPEDVNEIIQAIIKLALDVQLRLRTGEQAKKRVINNFNWSDKVNNIYKIIKRQ